MQTDPFLGPYRQCLIGHVANEAERRESASGGLATWLLCELLTAKRVDKVACVGPSGRAESLFGYRFCTRPDEVRDCARSAYYPVEVSEVVRYIRAHEGRYAITVLPCMAKALRLAARMDQVLQERMSYLIGLTCGQLKSKQFTAFAARLAGVDGPVARVNYRRKNPGRRAGEFSFVFEDLHAHASEILFPGSYWNRRWFTLAACNVCDDMFAELADLSVMDAWLPEHVHDSRGTSIVVVRHPELEEMFIRGGQESRLAVQPIPPARVVASQSGALQYKRAPVRWKVDKPTSRRYGQKRHRGLSLRDWVLLEPLRLRLLRMGQARRRRQFQQLQSLAPDEMVRKLDGPERILLILTGRYAAWVSRFWRLGQILRDRLTHRGRRPAQPS